MLFRTKFVLSVGVLALVALGCAVLLIVSAQRSGVNHTRTTLAYESLSGYLQLSGSVFRTFKQARRDLLSGSGEFAFDVEEARAGIVKTLSELEQSAITEVEKASAPATNLDNVRRLKTEIAKAFDGIDAAARQIRNGRAATGRAKATDILENQVDISISRLIETGIALERHSLQVADDEIRRFNEWSNTLAVSSVIIALIISTLVLVFLSPRFSFALRTLEAGAREYAAGKLEHMIRLPGDDELAAVAERFNSMAHQILSKRRALEKTQEELENRVKERTEELSKVNGELKERDRLRRQFFADIGHELRTPVTAIRGEAEVALRSRQDKQSAYQAALRTIVSLSEQLTDNVSDLFLIAREQAGVLDFRHSVLDLNGPVRLGAGQMASLAAKNNATLELKLPAQDLMIEGDANRIAQLLRILISNALTHGQDGVRITVATRPARDGGAVLEVGDDGPGIPQEDRERIFERYIKGTRHAKGHAPGTGLGLAIAKSITQAHGGVISVEESAGGGARIIARFPGAAEE